MIPERISSLILTSTKAGDKFDLPSWKVRPLCALSYRSNVDV